MTDNLLTTKVHTADRLTFTDKLNEDLFQRDDDDNSNNGHEISAGTNILSLDDDSLLHLFKYISLNDQLSLVCAHVRFHQIFQMHAKVNIRDVNEYDLQHLTQKQIRYFFQIAGEYLQTLILLAGFEQNKCDSGFTLVKIYCPNLKRLSLWGTFGETIENFDRFLELLSNKPNLKTLRLQRLCLKDYCLDLIIKPVLTQLEHLSIVNCSEFRGSSLKKLVNLKKLRLENLKNLHFSALQEALAVMPNLYAFSYLEAEQNYDMSLAYVDVLNCLQLYNRNIEILELNMHNTTNVHVSQLPKLKHFTYGIRDNNRLITIHLSELLNKKRHELESLRIVSFWDFQFHVEQCQFISEFTNLKKLHLPWKDLSKHGIIINDDSLRHLCKLQKLVEFKACGGNKFTKDGLLDLVRSCRNLKWVNIQCSLIDNRFANELIPVVEEQGQRPNGRITFLVYGTKMNKLKLPEVYNSKTMKSLVEFIFDELFTLDSYDNLYDDFEHDGNFIRTPFCAYS